MPEVVLENVGFNKSKKVMVAVSYGAKDSHLQVRSPAGYAYTSIDPEGTKQIADLLFPLSGRGQELTRQLDAVMEKEARERDRADALEAEAAHLDELLGEARDRSTPQEVLQALADLATNRTSNPEARTEAARVFLSHYRFGGEG